MHASLIESDSESRAEDRLQAWVEIGDGFLAVLAADTRRDVLRCFVNSARPRKQGGRWNARLDNPRLVGVA